MNTRSPHRSGADVRLVAPSVARRLLILALCLIASGLLGGCFTYSIGTRQETQHRNPVDLGRTDVYEVAGVSLSGDTLVVALDRSCQERQRVDTQVLEIETRKYDTIMAWTSVGLVGLAGGTAALAVEIDDPEAAETIGWVTLGSMLATAAIALGFELAEPEYETVLESRQEEIVTEVGCGSWPDGRVTLMAAAVGQSFRGDTEDGTVKIDVTDATRDLWASSDALQLELPGITGWIPVELPQAVRAAGLEKSGEALISVHLRLDDSMGDGDGMLEAGETARLEFEVVNNGEATARDLSVVVTVDNAAGIDLEKRARVGDVAPGSRFVGSLDVAAEEDVEARTAVFEAALETGSEVIGTDKLRVEVLEADSAERVYVFFEASDDYEGLLEAGITRVQSVLTETTRYKIVSEGETRDMIQQILESGGGSVEERRQSAVEAARQANISKVFELRVQKILGTQVQFVLAVYNTVSGDRIFLKDVPADTNDAFQALDGFDELANAFIEWSGR